MFVSKTILKRLMKKTFRYGGLTIASAADKDLDEWIYIGGSYWDMWCLQEFLDKEIKAAIIELTGQLPHAGEAYKATKGENQMVMISTILTSEGLIEDVNIPYTPTVLYQMQGDTLLHFLQGPSEHIVAVNSVFTNMVYEGKGTEKRDDGEIPASGPYGTANFDDVIVWKNNVSALRIHGHYPNEKNGENDLWDYLQGIKIPEKR